MRSNVRKKREGLENFMKIVARSRAHPLQSVVGAQARALPDAETVGTADHSFQSNPGVVTCVISALSKGLDDIPSEVLLRLQEARNAALAKRHQ